MSLRSPGTCACDETALYMLRRVCVSNDNAKATSSYVTQVFILCIY